MNGIILLIASGLGILTIAIIEYYVIKIAVKDAILEIEQQKDTEHRD
jgi:hypothetical protein